MADFDSFNYDIKSRLPEWWKESKFLRPINEFTQQLISDIIESLLSSTGVVQPLNCWLTIPEEYTWYHRYKPTDKYLRSDANELSTSAITTLYSGDIIYATLPNTKRECDAKIQLKLLGSDITKVNGTLNEEEGEIEYINRYLDYKSEVIEKLTITNADQILTLHNINSISTIEINTEMSEILVDGKDASHLIEGEIHKIKPTIKYSDYKQRYIDEETQEEKKIIERIDEETEEIIYKNIELEDENKKTEISIQSTTNVNFDLQIYLKKPTYTTEQNIRISSVSAFPIERVELYGYFCHPFNNNAGYKQKPLFTKTYTEKSRTVYDRITKQFDCERFYIKVKFYGVSVPLVKGFPQAYNDSNKAFQPNPHLDKWGKIYGLPRRKYKTNITKDEEPFTFPKYYNYPIEQDYWYEERMTNEYKFDDEAINSLFIKDSDNNNIGVLECISPYADDIWVYTETINPTNDIIEKQKVIEYDIWEIDDSPGKDWDKIKFKPYSPGEEWQIETTNPCQITLNPQSEDVLKLHDYSYQSKKLTCSFDLRDLETEIPKTIEITGLELKLKTNVNVQSNTIKLSEESKIILPYFLKNNQDIILEKINIIRDEEIWLKEKGYYTIGGEDNLFGESKITKEQLFYGNDGELVFELVFINENKFLESILYLEDISLNIYYKEIKGKYDIQVKFDRKEINLQSETEKQKITMTIDVANIGDIEIYNKEITIIIPPELQILQDNNGNIINSFKFNLKKDESFSIPNIQIIPTIFNEEGIKTGWYDILVICEDKIISNEIIIRGKGE